MPPGGFVTFERRLFEPDYLLAGRWKGLEYKYAWMDLISMASHRPYNGLERGQLRASVRFLAARWGWGNRRVVEFVHGLRDAGMVEHFTHQKGKHLPSIITICNYDHYQTPGRSAETLEETRVESTLETTLETKTTSNKKQEKETSTSLTRIPESEVEVVRNGELVNGPPPLNVAVPALLAFWIDQQTVKPTRAELSKQGAVVKRLVRNYGAYETAEAFMGIGYLFAYREGIYDAFDVERQFTKARQAFHQNEKTYDVENVDWGWLFNR